VAREQVGSVRQLVEEAVDRTREFAWFTPREVGASRVLPKEGIAGEDRSTDEERDTARGMSRHGDHAEGLCSEAKVGSFERSQSRWDPDRHPAECRGVHRRMPDDPFIGFAHHAIEVELVTDSGSTPDVIRVSMGDKKVSRLTAGLSDRVDQSCFIRPWVDDQQLPGRPVHHDVAVLFPGKVGHDRDDIEIIDQRMVQSGHRLRRPSV